jgi:hypothetical protein
MPVRRFVSFRTAVLLARHSHDTDFVVRHFDSGAAALESRGPKYAGKTALSGRIDGQWRAHEVVNASEISADPPPTGPLFDYSGC